MKDALLVLLSDGPRHGYQLKTEFDEAMGSAWPLNIGQVYTTLQRLERDELVAALGEPDDDGRRPYTLTAEGREAARDWLTTAAVAAGSTRDEASLKILIAVMTESVSALDVVNDERAAAMSHLQERTAHKARSRDMALTDRLHLDRIIMLADAHVRWLNLVEERLHADPRTLTSSATSKEGRL